MKEITFLFLAALLVGTTNPTVYHVEPDHDGNNTLQYYINNSNEYFTSNTEFLFNSGQYYLNTSILIKDLRNFTMKGMNTCKMTCAEFVSIIVINVTKFRLEDIKFQFKNSPNNYQINMHPSFKFTESLQIKTLYNASIVLYQCTSVAITKVEIINNAGITGIALINVVGKSEISQLSIILNCTICPTVKGYPMSINGVILLYKDWDAPNVNYRGMYDALTIDRFLYKMHGSCSNPSQYAIKLTLSQKFYNNLFLYSIKNIIFNNVNNSSALYFHMNTCNINLTSFVKISNFTAIKNIGNPHMKMFHIVLYNNVCFDKVSYSTAKSYPKHRYNKVSLSFIDCKFNGNADMKSMIYIEPTSSRVMTGYVRIRRCKFCNNKNVNFVNVESEREIFWQLTVFVLFQATVIESNVHNSSNNLISITNGIVSLYGPILARNNINYYNILILQSSVMVFNNYVEISRNLVRQVLMEKYGSYLIVTEDTTVNISLNTVYMVAVQERTYRINSERICPFQFQTSKFDNLDKAHNYSFQIVVYGNLHMTSKNLPGDSISTGDCTWLAGTAFQTTEAKNVFNKVLKVRNTVINETLVRPIPLSVCLCSQSENKSNCYLPDLGQMFPGQTLTVRLTVSKLWLQQERLSHTTLVVKNSPSDDCNIVDTSQLSQTNFNHGCNQYSYTLWPLNKTIKTCKLFLGLDRIPEMFYVHFKSCPKGFTLQEDKKACSCDPILQYSPISITSCYLDDEAVLRPANSWISATTTNDLHYYQVSSNCPFDYCLPHPSYLNLSMPDSQCQFNRSGVLCGQCQHGLSAVFGSSQCTHCSNVYLFITIPIAIAGVVLVIMLFIFNLTVLNETINTFTFYVNIININMLTFYPVCQPGTCTMIALFNLDLGIQTCFYKGMDDYAKMWLQLAFPLYLIMIAILLILGSRYSNRIQRMTAHRALPVLSTIFLLSYTKILRTVCNVLFWYFKVIHLPSNETEIFWSVDSTTRVFSVKFLMMFVVNFVIFLVLLPFNLVLIFPRLLLRIKFVSTFKPLLDTFIGPFKDNVSYWTGILLLVRVMVFGLSALDKDGSLLAISVLLGSLLFIQGVLYPFKNKQKNIQESFLLFTLLTVHVAPLYKHHSLGLKISQVLITVSVTYLLLAIMIHCLIFRCKNYLLQKVKKLYVIACKVKPNKINDDAEMNRFTSEILEVTYNYKEFQEPLIGLDK